MARQDADVDLAVETPSGKGAGDENFPVASRLIAPALRPHVFAFYDFVRAADDIADNPALSPDAKLERLDEMAAGLRVDGPLTKPRRLAKTLHETGVSATHAHAMLSAFRQDAVKQRYETMDELWDYCDRSACPVGRFLVDLHGEDRGCYRGADALSAVLQVLNHVQDCKKDFVEMDRVYLPLEVLSAHGARVDELGAAAITPPLRRALNDMLEGCACRMSDARKLAAQIKDRRFAAETRVIVSLAQRLRERLAQQDPVAGRVKLSAIDFGSAAAKGVGRYFGPRWI